MTVWELLLWNKHFHTSTKRSRFYDINRAPVLAFRSIGRGCSAAQKFCSIVNFPNPVGKKPWTRHTQAILKAEIISSLKFLASFEPAALSFEVSRPLRVPAFPLPFARVLYVVSLVFSISAKTLQARRRGWLRRDAKQFVCR